MSVERLALVARELSALAGADRRAILAAFEPEERGQLLAAMRGLPVARPFTGGAVPSHSDWFEALLAESSEVTSSARAALAEAAGRARDTMPAQSMPGRSLLQAAGGLLGQVRTR